MTNSDDLGDIQTLQRERNPLKKQLIEAEGVSLDELFEITNVIYASDRVSAWSLANDLKPGGFELLRIEDAENESSGKWPFVIELIYKTIPTLENLNRMTDVGVARAHARGAEYDGWFVQV